MTQREMHNQEKSESTIIKRINKVDISDKTFALFRKLTKATAPPKKYTVSEWADANRFLSEEASAEPGRWSTDRAPYQREPMDAMSDPRTRKVVLMTSAQVGKSEVLNNGSGYYMDHDPSPILFIQPTKDLAEDYSKDRIAPMIRDTPCLTKKVADPKARDSSNSILHKNFPGGHLTLVGANTPSKLASRPIRVVFMDEVDRFPISAGKEGDPAALAEKRTTTFWNSKVIMASTPTIKGSSKIETEYNATSMEEWNVSCPECSEYQSYEFSNLVYEELEDEKFTLDGYACKYCGTINPEYVWKKQPGRWIAQYPDRIKKRGFHLNELTSPWKRWHEIIEDYILAKKDPETFKVWWNTSLGLPWEEKGEIESEEVLLERREEYSADLPDGVCFLTAGVDVQENRLEFEVCGWGPGEEAWGIECGKVIGRPDDEETWERLYSKLSSGYKFSDGTKLNVAGVCVDSGYMTSEVYKFCKKHELEKYIAIKGKGGPGLSLIEKIGRSKKEKALLAILGVDSGKATIMTRLRDVAVHGPAYLHFPLDEKKGYDRNYFKGLLNERQVRKYVRGRKSIIWEKINKKQANEPLDLRNYALAALRMLNPDLDKFKDYIDTLRTGGAAAVASKKSSPVKKRKSGVVSRGVM